MMKKLFTIVLATVVMNNAYSQQMPVAAKFLGETPPSQTPKPFPLKVDEGYFAAERISITKDGKEIYYSQIKGYYPETGLSVKRYCFVDGKWRGPEVVFEGYAAPVLSLSEDTMYVEYNFETFMSIRSEGKWSRPARVFSDIDSVHYFQRTNGGDYVSARTKKGAGMADWCKLDYNGEHPSAVSLGRPLNTGGDNLDYFISADESFMVVTNRPKFGISFKKSDGTWTSPKGFGPVIDFGLNCWGPYVTNDNKYLFYTTGTKQDYSDVQVHWVRIDGIIDSLRNSNQIPYIKSLIADVQAAVGKTLNYTISDNQFFDDDNENEPLVYSATLLNGTPLPGWLSFDPLTHTLSGIPAEKCEVIVKITVTDRCNATAFCPIKIICS